MTLWLNRRSVFFALPTMAVAILTETVGAQQRDVHGCVTYAGGQVIPAGRIEIFVEDTALRDGIEPGTQNTHIESDKKSHQIKFPFKSPAIMSGSTVLRLVAHLDREDGWLLVCGSAHIKAGRPISIMLNSVMC